MKKRVMNLILLVSAAVLVSVQASQSTVSNSPQTKKSWFKSAEDLYGRLTNRSNSPQATQEDYRVVKPLQEDDVEDGDYVAIGGTGMVHNEGLERLGKMSTQLREIQTKISATSFQLLNEVLEVIGKRFALDSGVITKKINQDLHLLDDIFKEINEQGTDADSEVLIEAVYMTVTGKRPEKQELKVEHHLNTENTAISQLQAQLIKAQERINEIEVNSQQVTPQTGVVHEGLKRELQELKQKNKDLEDQVTFNQKELEKLDQAQQACQIQAKKLKEQAKMLEQFEELQRELNEQRDRYDKQLEDSKKQAELYLKQSVTVKSSSSDLDKESEEVLRQMSEEIRKKDQELQRLYDLLKQLGVTTDKEFKSYFNEAGEEVFE